MHVNRMSSLLLQCCCCSQSKPLQPACGPEGLISVQSSSDKSHCAQATFSAQASCNTNMDRRPNDEGGDPGRNKQQQTSGTQQSVDAFALDGGGAAFIMALVVLGLVSGAPHVLHGMKALSIAAMRTTPRCTWKRLSCVVGKCMPSGCRHLRKAQGTQNLARMIAAVMFGDTNWLGMLHEAHYVRRLPTCALACNALSCVQRRWHPFFTARCCSI